MAGEVSVVTHGGRAYWVKFHKGGGRLFTWVDLKKDKSGVYGYTDREMRQLAELWESHNPVGIQPRGSEEGSRVLCWPRE